MTCKGAKLYSLKERQLIEKMVKSGYTGAMMADQLKRSKGGINAEIARNGGRSCYNAEKAHELFTQLRQNKIDKLKHHYSVNQTDMIKIGLQKGLSLHELSTLTGSSRHKLRAWINENTYKLTENKNEPIEDRLSALEQHVDIILDILKEKQ
jgi:IS30 family transposase